MMIVLAWSFAAVGISLAMGLIALGIELNRRDYRDRARAAEFVGGVGGAAFAAPAREVDGDLDVAPQLNAA